MAENEVKIKISAQDDASGVLKKTSSNMEKFGKTFSTTASGISSSASNITRNLSNLGSTVGSVAVKGLEKFASAAKIASIAMAGLGGLGIKLGADMEMTNVAFGVLTGGAENAKGVLSELATFAAKTPFEFPELADAGKKMLAFGFSTAEVVPELTKLGDISAGLGINIGELSEIYGKARVQGRLFAEDVNQLTGRGIPVIQEFAKQFGVSEGEVKKLVEQGKIGFPQLQQAITSLTSEGGKFAGMMEKQSQTASGLYSTLKDNLFVALKEIIGVTQTGEVIQGSIFDKIKDAMTFLISFLESNKDKIIAVFNSIVGFFANFAGRIKDTLSGLSNTGGVSFQKLSDTIKNIMTGIANFVVTALQKIVAFWNKYGQDIMTVVGAVFGLVKTVVETTMRYIRPIVEGVLNAIGGVFRILAAIIKGDFSKAWDGLKSLVSGVVSSLYNIVKVGLDLIGQAFLGLGKWLFGIVDNIGKTISGLFNNMFNSIVNLFKTGTGQIASASSGLATEMSKGFVTAEPTIKASIFSTTENMKASFNSMYGSVTNTINATANNVSTATGGMSSKVNENLGKIQKGYEDLASKTADSLGKLKDDFNKTTEEIGKKATDLTKQFTDLKQSFQESQQGTNVDIASAFVDQQDKIADIQNQIAEKEKEIARAGIDENTQAQQEQLAQLRARLVEEQVALESHSDLQKQLTTEIAEARKLADMTEFDRFIFQTQQKQAKELETFNKKKQQIFDEAKALIDSQALAKTQYENTKTAIITSYNQAHQVYTANINNQAALTKQKTDEMIGYFNGLSQAIQSSVSIQSSAFSNISGKGKGRAFGGIIHGSDNPPTNALQKFATGGVVQGSRGVDNVPAMLSPGELILNRAQQQALASSFDKGGPGTTIQVNVSGNSFYGDDKDFADKIGDTIIENFKKHYAFESF